MKTTIITAMLMAAPVLADHLTVVPRAARGYDPRAREGWCSVRVWVDDEVNVFVQGGRMMFQNIHGRRPYDAGTECTAPMPGPGLTDFRFRGIDGRGRVQLMEAPSRRNGYRAWVRILDHRGGGEEHHFRLYWRNDGRYYDPYNNDRHYDNDRRYGNDRRYDTDRRDDYWERGRRR